MKLNVMLKEPVAGVMANSELMTRLAAEVGVPVNAISQTKARYGVYSVPVADEEVDDVSSRLMDFDEVEAVEIDQVRSAT